MSPTVQGETLDYRQDGQEKVLTVGTAAWLETASTFSLIYNKSVEEALHSLPPVKVLAYPLKPYVLKHKLH